jgi:ribosomal protein L14E/L6E/L27E
MLSNNLSVGQVVKATSGKEQDKLFFIIKIVDHQYVLNSRWKEKKTW